MSDVKYLQVEIVDKNTIRLQEDGKNGQQIRLDQIIKVDQSNILNTLEQAQREAYEREAQSRYQTKLAKELSEKDNTFLKQEAAWNQAHNTQIQQLYQQITNLENQVNNIKRETESKKDNEYQQQIVKLETQLQSIKKETESQKDLEYERKANKTKEENQQELERQRQYFLEQLEQAQKDIEELKTREERFSKWAIAKKGKELEKWCWEAYKNYEELFQNCVFAPYSELVKGAKKSIGVEDDESNINEKADFIFQVFNPNNDKEPFFSICCEMKTEFTESKSRTKNEDHVKKLIADAKRAKCQYGFLVSELELNTENDVQVQRMHTSNSEVEVYLVRPMFFIVMLRLFYFLAKKMFAQVDVNSEYLDKEALNASFSDLKKSLLEKTFTDLNKVFQNNIDELEKIEGLVTKLKAANEKALNSRLNNWEEKIRKFEFKLNKDIVKKLE